MIASMLMVLAAPACFADEAPTEVVPRKTSDGVRFATLGDKPAKPAPTVFVFATGTKTSLSQPVYLEAGTVLGKKGAGKEIPAR